MNNIAGEETNQNDRWRNQPEGGKGGIQRLGAKLKASHSTAGCTKKGVIRKPPLMGFRHRTSLLKSFGGHSAFTGHFEFLDIGTHMKPGCQKQNPLFVKYQSIGQHQGATGRNPSLLFTNRWIPRVHSFPRMPAIHRIHRRKFRQFFWFIPEDVCP